MLSLGFEKIFTKVVLCRTTFILLIFRQSSKYFSQITWKCKIVFRHLPKYLFTLMKNRNIVSIILISLAYLSPIFTTLYFRNELSKTINLDGSDPFSAWIIVAYLVHIFKYFKNLFKPQIVENQALNSSLKIVWATFYLSILGLVFYYTHHYEPNMGYIAVLVLFGIFIMIDGNYQSVILPKNIAFENGIGEGYEENVYKKSQRLTERFQFYFGLVIVIFFLILLNTLIIWLYGIFGILTTYYVGGWFFMYRNTQIIADSESKTK